MITVLRENNDVKRLISSSGGNAGHAVATAGQKIGIPVGLVPLPSYCEL
jgi:threonine dehydratase